MAHETEGSASSRRRGLRSGRLAMLCHHVARTESDHAPIVVLRWIYSAKSCVSAVRAPQGDTWRKRLILGTGRKSSQMSLLAGLGLPVRAHRMALVPASTIGAEPGSFARRRCGEQRASQFHHALHGSDVVRCMALTGRVDVSEKIPPPARAETARQRTRADRALTEEHRARLRQYRAPCA